MVEFLAFIVVAIMTLFFVALCLAGAVILGGVILLPFALAFRYLTGSE